jgi:two-component system cell cycle sensor histidine kinase/response regulator CckA
MAVESERDRSQLRDEDRFRILVERSPYCIHEIDREGRLVSMNAAGLCMMGVREEAEIVGLPYVAAATEGDRERIARLLERALEGHASEFEFTAINGRSFRSLFEPIRDEDGRVRRLMGITQDTTDQRALEAQLRRSQKLDGLGQLAGGIAHDFNNLLQVISGNVELAGFASKRGLAGELAASLEDIRRATEQAAELTRRLLAVGRQQPLRLESLSLSELLAGQAGMLRRILSEAIEIVFEPAEDATWVRADRAQLEQVVLNLCLNASQAMPQGGTLRLRASRDTDSMQVRAEVEDTGVGMSQEVRERAFEPFFTTKAQHQGTGLGLSMAYAIVDQHGGRLGIESTPGEGTRVAFELPATRLDEQAPPAEKPTKAGHQGNGERILVAEDQAPVRELLVRILTSANYTVTSAADGLLALEHLEQSPAVDLLLLDAVMPRMGGYEVWARVRSSGTPVLFLSGYSAEALSHDDLAAQGVRILQKPVQASELLQAVYDALHPSLT